MTALAADAGQNGTGWSHLDYEVTPSPLQKGATKIYNGALTNWDANGYLVPAADVAAHKCAGVSREFSDTTGIADGVQRVRLMRGVVKLKTTGANALTIADCGKLAYVLDDQTVVRAAGTTNSIIAGRVDGVDPNDGSIYVDLRTRV